MTTADLTATAGIDAPTGLLIGGEWIDGRRRRAAGHRPGHRGDRSPRSPTRTRGGRAGRGRRGARRAARLGRDPAPAARRVPAPGLGADDRAVRGAGPADGAGERQGAAGRARRDHLRGRVLPLVRRGGGPATSGSLVTAPSGANRIMVQHQPVGVSVLVTPWNFPAAMATRKIGPALAAGCTVVLEAGQGDAAVRARRRRHPARGRRADGVVNVVHARPARAGGRRDAGRPAGPQAVLHRLDRGRPGAAATRPPTSHQLLDGTRRQRAVPDLRGRGHRGRRSTGAFLAKMRNGGEACTAANRFYVHEAVADEFTARFAGPAGRAQGRPGPGRRHRPRARWSTRTPGPRWPAWSRTRPRRAAGWSPAAPPRTGAATSTRPRCWTTCRPALASWTRRSSARSRRSSGSPTEAEAIALANDTEYGLVSYVYTRDLRRALQVAEALEAGHDRHQPRRGVRPGGAVRRGQAVRAGPRGGHDGLLEFTETKYIAVDW